MGQEIVDQLGGERPTHVFLQAGVGAMAGALTGFFADKLFGQSPEAFEILHEGGGFCLVALTVLHLVLNWNWIKAAYLRTPTAAKT